MKRFKNKQKFASKVAIIAASSLLSCFSYAGVETYEAIVGNHEFVSLEINDLSEETPAIHLQMIHMNGRLDSYSLDFETKNILVQTGDASITQVTPEDKNYNNLVLKVRDLVAYLASPTSLDMSYPSPHKVLRPELNSLIEKINNLSSLGKEELANCVLFSESQERSPWFLSAGVHGSLGQFQDNVARVWVRLGYELVLMSHKGFAEEESVVITAKGDGLSTGSGLPVLESMPPHSFSGLTTDDAREKNFEMLGAHYSLAQTDLYRHVGSVVCRPDLSNSP